MGTPSVSDDERLRRKNMVESVLRDGYPPMGVQGKKGSCVSEAAKRLGVPRGTINSWLIAEEGLKATSQKNFVPDWSLYVADPMVVSKKVDRPTPTVDDRIRERRLEQEIASLKKREKDLLDQVITLQDVRGTIMNLADALEAPAIIQPAPGSKRGGKRTAILHISDVHCGESVDLYEMDGLNSYSGEICKARMHRLFQKTASLLTEHWSGDPVEEIVICLGGDMIDGNLREESRRGGAMPVVESAKLISELTAGGIKFLHEEVRVPIRVYTSPGNHGRLSLKPHVNEGAIDNWDMMISWSIEKILGKQDWVKFYYTGSGEALYNVYGWWFLLQHGHEGVGGTGGLYGPVYKQVRGMYRTHQSYGRRGRGFHYVLEGHNHTSVKIPFGFANGSVVGYSPYSARALKADPSPASQNLLTVEERLGVIAWNELFLGVPEEGTLYEPPRDRGRPSWQAGDACAGWRRPLMMIGLTGARNVGKSTVANMLVESFGFRRIHAFDGGKAATVAYFIHLGATSIEANEMVYGSLKDLSSDILPGRASPRFFMEKFGRFMGTTLGPDWTLGAEISRHRRADPSSKLIAESLVYESDLFRSAGGIIVRVERPGHVGPVGCESDSFQAGIVEDHRLINGGSLTELRKAVSDLVHKVER